jgi:predicted N-formylglutamate amidohydrolase
VEPSTAEQVLPASERAKAGAVEASNLAGASDLVIACEHASCFVPAEFAGLGLTPALLQSHIAWDPGALAVARHLAERLDAPLVAAGASRLLYDCNRPPEAAGAIPAKSEIYEIPGNLNLSPAARQARIARFYLPFRDTLGAVIEQRLARRRAPLLVTIHSFTPVYAGAARELDIGVLHDSDARLADALLAAMAPDARFTVRRNEPYGPQDGVTHTLRTQAVARGLLNVMIEIRNDLLASAAAQQAMAGWLYDHIERALGALESESGAGDNA